MSLLKRLRVILAAATQDIQPYRCPCGAESFVVGFTMKAKPLLDGLLCETCEAKEFEKWMNDFYRRVSRQKDVA